MSHPDEISEAVKPVAEALEQLGVLYYIGGSVASSAYGIARSTLDVDIVSALRLEHIPQLVAILKDKYYISEDSIADAIRSKASFNLLHLESALKIDIFITKNRTYDQTAAKRIRADTISVNEDAPRFYLSAPEDVVLAKLEWLKSGGQTSERQWNDILGVLKVQGVHIDEEYLRLWAGQLGVLDLLERALGANGE
jgi:hypothetical protein